MSQKNEEFRVVYLGNAEVVSILKEDFKRAGAQLVNGFPERFTVGEGLARRISLGGAKSASLKAKGISGAVVYFFEDVFSVARELPLIDADLLIVDERTEPPSKKQGPAKRIRKERSVADAAHEISDEEKEKKAEEEVLRHFPDAPDAEKVQIHFENLQKALLKFTPREFHYPSRRILVVLPETARQTTRAFILGHANVRGVILEPASSIELFLFATRQLFEFRKKQTKTSVCISGGGLEGYLYSLGVLHALDACLFEKDCAEFDIYCGVSSGAILGSSLAAGISTDDLMKQIYKRQGKLEPLTLGVIFDFASGEIFKRVLGIMRSFTSLDAGEIITRLQGLVPLGFFKGDKLRSFVERQLRRVGIPDNISALKKELYISATDLDTGEHVVFGEEPWRDVRISQAVRGSTALPPFYLPESINGHWFTDGQLTSSSDFNLAIKKGAGLVILVDPMVAFTSNIPGLVMRNGGYFSAVQAIKSLVHTRSASMLKHSMDLNPDVDFIVFRPTDEVMEAMAGNPMKYRIRTELAELGFRGTVAQILSQYEAFSHKLAKHGFHLKSMTDIAALLK